MALDQSTDGSAAQDGAKSVFGQARFNTVMLGFAAMLVCLIALRQFAGIIGPLFLALNLMITAYPLHTWLVRHRSPSWLSAIAVSLTVFSVLLALIVGLVWSVSEMIAILPRYSDEFTALYQQGANLALELGFQSAAIDWILSSLDPTRVLSFASSLVSGVTGVLAISIVVVAAIVFMTMDTPRMERRLRMIANERPRLAHAMGEFAHGVRRYWLVTTIFGIIVAVLDGIALVVMGVPLVLVWALLSFLTNYIPNVGFVIGLIPPALVALFANGWQTSLLVIVTYAVLNFVVQSIIQPRFTGESVGVAPTISFVSLLLWTAVIGAMGTLLALPLTLLVKSLVIDADPHSRWVNALIASDLQDADPDDLSG